MTDRLGGYWLGSRLGAAVHDAYDESGTRYALTLLPSRPSFQVKAAMQVRARSVARVVDACLDGDVPYLVSEYIPGPTLGEVVGRRGPYEGDDLYLLAAATATALAAIHEAGAVHGGLTPDRVVLGAEGPRLVGLGLGGDGSGAPGDVRGWGRLLVFAAYGPSGAFPPPDGQDRLPDQAPVSGRSRDQVPVADRSRDQAPVAGRSRDEPSRAPVRGRPVDQSDRLLDRLDRPLRELVLAALRRDPDRRPSAHQLLLSLLDVPQSQQGRLLPPEPVDDPPLGARAESLYLQLSRADQDLVPEVFLRLVGMAPDGTDTRRRATRTELVTGRPPEQAAMDRVLTTYTEAGLITQTHDPSSPAAPNHSPSAPTAPNHNPSAPALHPTLSTPAPNPSLAAPTPHPSLAAQNSSDLAQSHAPNSTSPRQTPAVQNHGPNSPSPSHTPAAQNPEPELADQSRAPGGDGVIIAHAALLRAWPRLHEWLDAERDGLAVHRDLTRAARRWEAGGRRETDLFQEDELDRALVWAASGRRRVTLSAAEQAFLDGGRALVRGRARGRRRAMAVLASVTLVAVLAAIVVAIWQNGSADGRLDQAMARVAASRARALRAADPVTARRLSLAAWRLAPVAEARAALADSAADPAVDVFAAPFGGARSLDALSDDGTRLAALTDGTLRVYDTLSGRQLATTAGPAQSVRAMAWSPDGQTLALVGVDRSYLWNTTSGAGVGPPFGRGLGAPGQQSAWFSPGGGLLFAAARQSGERWAWNLRTGRATFVGQYVVVGPRDRVALVFAGTRSEVVRLSTGARTPAPWLDRMPWEYAVFSPEGERVAIAEETGVQIYALNGVPVLPARLRPSPGHLRFSTDGQLLASTDSDRVRVWRVADGTRLTDRQVPATGTDHPAQAALAPDGRWLRVLADHGTVLTIDLAHATPPPDPARSAASICFRYGGLSQPDWNEYLSEVPYRPVC
ncbi:hypothetical protein [Nonomuraea sp. NEAU-A123]|uniref:nSTAND1 domain-containing NTPase n=1 Tax=Nonomuraea sp. NEAU-A123 TaxID=2839649 RepID=UPI001BE42C20|nr:hypothetical protein [Nonomuraea sp. NEAU-A123]MBT2228141.1 hypothetical protein [Nonomuraea sp. NEAU-A123]